MTTIRGACAYRMHACNHNYDTYLPACSNDGESNIVIISCSTRCHRIMKDELKRDLRSLIVGAYNTIIVSLYNILLMMCRARIKI